MSCLSLSQKYVFDEINEDGCCLSQRSKCRLEKKKKSGSFDDRDIMVSDAGSCKSLAFQGDLTCTLCKFSVIV